MNTYLRITLLATFCACGIATAVALALNKPPGKPAKELLQSASAAAAPATQQPVVAEYRDPVAQQFSQLDEVLTKTRELVEQTGQDLERKIADVASQVHQQPPLAAVPPATVPPGTQAPPPPDQREPLPTPMADRLIKGEGDNAILVNVQNSDIRQVLEMIAEQGGLNILASSSVQGTVTASLTNVDIDTALSAILKSTGFVARREGKIIYVGKPADMEAMDQTVDRIITKVYKPNYIKAADLQFLIAPHLSKPLGSCSVSAPSEVDIPSDQNKTGGNGYAGTDVVVVRDYETVIAEIDQLYQLVDVKPKQVAIEAMILSVSLSDEYKFGVNFAALRNNANVRLISGNPAASLASITTTDGGFKFGFLDSNLALFINALETIGDTNVIASPRLTCLNKQRAEIQIGEELGYVSTTITETSSTQSINFLETGALLRIRPFIGDDGMIRLEVHPELSTGAVNEKAGLAIPDKQVTQVTTNIMCPDGCTVVIGGLIREDLQTDTTQIPLLGNLPWVGPLFRQKTENVDRNEVIVLITPRIVSEPMMCEEGMKYGNQFTQRQNIYFDKMSCIGKRNYGNHYLRLARAAYHAGDYNTAMRQVNLALHFDPLNRDAVVLRNEVVAAGGFEQESIHEYLHYGLGPVGRTKPDYSKDGYPWKEFEGFSGQHEVTAVDDPGQPGPIQPIERPRPPLPAIVTPPPPAQQGSRRPPSILQR
ncbi:MAG: secretin and TonB N-terminal domain-containing protein [Planctomycetaceae bacterium]|nr:secretin and TonB N-terminal domain-containing protein [Planctomycetaceae bacterium]